MCKYSSPMLSASWSEHVVELRRSCAEESGSGTRRRAHVDLVAKAEQARTREAMAIQMSARTVFGQREPPLAPLRRLACPNSARELTSSSALLRSSAAASVLDVAGEQEPRLVQQDDPQLAPPTRLDRHLPGIHVSRSLLLPRPASSLHTDTHDCTVHSGKTVSQALPSFLPATKTGHPADLN